MTTSIFAIIVNNLAKFMLILLLKGAGIAVKAAITIFLKIYVDKYNLNG